MHQDWLLVVYQVTNVLMVFPGVCMKQQKRLNEAVNTARDHGMLLKILHIIYLKCEYSIFRGIKTLLGNYHLNWQPKINI